MKFAGHNYVTVTGWQKIGLPLFQRTFVGLLLSYPKPFPNTFRLSVQDSLQSLG